MMKLKPAQLQPKTMDAARLGGDEVFRDDGSVSTASGMMEEGVSESEDTGTLANKGKDDRLAEQKKQEEELLNMVKGENKAVFWLRAFLMVCLLVSAIVCALLIFFYSSSEEEEAFDEQFESDSQKLFESIGTNFDLTMGAADAFMFQIISQAKSTNSTWPFVTIPDLPQKTAKLISQTDSIYMAFYPLITGAERFAWENFTKENDGWVADSLRVQSRNPNFHGPILLDYPISHAIWNNEGIESYDNEGPFLPSWMGSPVIPNYGKSLLTTKSVVVEEGLCFNMISTNDSHHHFHLVILCLSPLQLERPRL